MRAIALTITLPLFNSEGEQIPLVKYSFNGHTVPRDSYRHSHKQRTICAKRQLFESIKPSSAVCLSI